MMPNATTPADSPLHGQVRLESRGPGLIESVGWTVGYLVAQMVAALSLIVLLVLFAFEGVPTDAKIVEEVFLQMSDADVAWLSVYVTGGATLGALFFIVPFACLRWRPSPRRTLGTHSPNRRQSVLLAGVVLPLAVLSDETYRLASLWWERVKLSLVDVWPTIASFGQHDTIDLIQNQTADTAYPLLLVIVGVGPAIGEELIFRGVIGRGLVKRYGIFAGVLVTSLLFAVAHGAPAHAIATLPIALFLHLTYLATRTIWAPILVHFLNNALSVTMLKYHLGENVEASPFMLLSAAVYVTTIATLLWRTRPRDSPQSVDETPARRPSTLTVSTPTLTPSTLGNGVMTVVWPRWLTLVASTGVLAFTFTFVAAAMAG